MWTAAAPLPVSAEQRQTLESWVRAHSTPQSVVLRSRVVLLAGEGRANHAIASELKTRRAEAPESPYQQVLETALNCIRDANRRYVGADPYVKRLLKTQVLRRVEIKGGELVSVELKPPFQGLFLLAGSNRAVWWGKGTLFELPS